MKHLILGLLLFFSVAAKSQCDTMTSATFSSITQNSVFVSFTVSGSNWTTFNVTLYDSITSAVAFNNPTIYTTTFTATGLTPGRTYKLRTFTIAGMATCEPIVLSPRFRTLGTIVGYQPMAANGYLFKRIAVDSTFHIPFKDTSLNSGLTRPGALVVRPADSSFWAWNGSKWNLLSSSSSGLLPLINSKVDSVKYSGDTLYYYANGVAYGRVTNLSGKADTARLILDSTVLRTLINSNSSNIATNTTNIANEISRATVAENLKTNITKTTSDSLLLRGLANTNATNIATNSTNISNEITRATAAENLKTNITKTLSDSLTLRTLINAKYTLDSLTRFGGLKPIYRAYLDSLNILTKQAIDSGRITASMRMRLRSYQSKVAQINNNKTGTGIRATVNIGWIGDSIGADELLAAFNTFFLSLGFGGQHGGGAQTGILNTLASGTTVTGAAILITSLTSNGSGTATATSTAHGLSNGATVTISGAIGALYNKATTISGVTANTFDYAITGTPTTPDASSAIYFSPASDYTKWITGGWYNIPVGGTFTYSRASFSTLPNDSFYRFKVYYIKEVGGGSFKIQTSPDGTTWTDASGFTSISCVGSQNDLGIATVPVAGIFNLQVRAVGLSGSSKVVGIGVESGLGAKMTFMLSGGGLIMANMAITPARIWKAYLDDFQPDLLVVSFKDDTNAAMVAALQTFQTNIFNSAPNCAVVYAAAYNSRQDDTSYTPVTPYANTMLSQNLAIQRWLDTTTVRGEKYYFDANTYIGQWTNSAAMGFFDAAVADSLTAVTIAGTLATITTANPHGLSGSGLIRVNRVNPSEYNGIYTATATTTTTLTFTPLITPASNGIGGVSARLDGTHLSLAGRQLLSSAFNKDFAILNGLNSGVIGDITNAIKPLNVLTASLGVPITGVINSTNTRGVFGNTTASGGAAITTAGGISATGAIRTDSVLMVNTTSRNAAINATRNYVAGADVTGEQIITNLTSAINTSDKIFGSNINSTITSTSTANLTSYLHTGTRSDMTLAGTGTGTVNAISGISIGNAHNGSQYVSEWQNINIQMSGAATARFGTLYGSRIDIANSGTATNIYGYFVGGGLSSAVGTNKFGYYNNSTAGNYMGTGTTSIGTTTLNTNAAFQVVGTTKFSIPNPLMTIAQRDAITAVAGAQVFNNVTNKPNWHNGTTWRVGLDSVTAENTFLSITAFVKGTYSTTAAAMTTFTVTIGSTQANNTYNLAIAPTTVLAGASYYISAKTTTTFDVTYLTAITGSVSFDWTLFK